LPIKLPSANNKKQLQSKDQIIELVDKILQKVKLEQKIENFPEDYIKPYRMQGEEFDILLHRVKHSYKELKPKIQTTMNDKYRVSLGSGDAIYSNVIDSMQKAEYVKLCLEDKDFIKQNEIKILIPKNNKVISEIIKELENDKRLMELEPISNIEDEINKIVYALYELNNKDIKILESL
ncbi:MAG: hypothetical protein ACE5KE_13685, partial [Methanosarcinales archaeon]